jgi:hypothetical protein
MFAELLINNLLHINIEFITCITVIPMSEFNILLKVAPCLPVNISITCIPCVCRILSHFSTVSENTGNRSNA